MACEYVYPQGQDVSLNTPVLFSDSIPCRKGYVYHANNEGIFILRGAVNNNFACFAQYQVTYNGNISIPEGGTVAPIAIAITVNGEPKRSSRAIFTPSAVEEFGNVTVTAIVKVPRGCCFNIAIEPVVASEDPTVTPAPVITAQDSNLTIARIA